MSGPGAAAGAAATADIEIDALCHTFQRAGMVTQALDGVNLTVRPGELVVVVGPPYDKPRLVAHSRMIFLRAGPLKCKIFAFIA